ncbi:MAG: DinB family protein [Chitinophagales bacterium]|nr:DinB family protein [Chitinophagales bacterium]
MKKADIQPMPEYFDRYINKADDVSLTEALETSLNELLELPLDDFKALGDTTYAAGKWTIKDLLQHMIDTERIFAYRALVFAREEEGKVSPYDEELYAKNAHANLRTIDDLVDEWILARKSFIAMYKSFTKEMLLKQGKGYLGPYSVLSIGFLIPGHQRWHMEIVQERYLPLLKQK